MATVRSIALGGVQMNQIPAAETGWKEGDEITAIDGQKIGRNYSGSHPSRWAGGPAGTEVTLSLIDGSTRKLTLADYF